MLLVEGAAVALGIAYLLLAIGEHRSCWIAGGAASLLFLVVLEGAGLTMQAALQVYYVIVALHGWWHWGREDDALAPSHASARQHASMIVACLLLAAATQGVRGTFSDATAWVDSLTSWGGVLATWLVARKTIEAWLYWIVIDITTAGLYIHAGLLASSLLYFVYTGLAFAAWREWRRHFRTLHEQPASASA
jgi:nicotinamide mononucleotide transporter